MKHNFKNKLKHYDRQEHVNIKIIKGFIYKNNVKLAKKEIMACEKKKDELLIKYKVPYEDVTQKWLETATPNSHEVLYRDYYISESGIRYNVDSKNVIMTYNPDEKDTAIWLKETLGGEIYMNPKIDKPDGVESADYFFRGNNWDKKSMEKASSLKRAIDNAIKEHKEQSKRLIIDITNCKLSNETIIEQAINVFTPGEFNREWVEGIIIKREKELVKIIIKRK